MSLGRGIDMLDRRCDKCLNIIANEYYFTFYITNKINGMNREFDFCYKCYQTFRDDYMKAITIFGPNDGII